MVSLAGEYLVLSGVYMTEVTHAVMKAICEGHGVFSCLTTGCGTRLLLNTLPYITEHLNLLMVTGVIVHV